MDLEMAHALLLVSMTVRVDSWGRLYTADPVTHPNAVCLDGSSYGFYVDRVNSSAGYSKVCVCVRVLVKASSSSHHST